MKSVLDIVIGLQILLISYHKSFLNRDCHSYMTSLLKELKGFIPKMNYDRNEFYMNIDWTLMVFALAFLSNRHEFFITLTYILDLLLPGSSSVYQYSADEPKWRVVLFTSRLLFLFLKRLSLTIIWDHY